MPSSIDATTRAEITRAVTLASPMRGVSTRAGGARGRSTGVGGSVGTGGALFALVHAAIAMSKPARTLDRTREVPHLFSETVAKSHGRFPEFRFAEAVLSWQRGLVVTTM